MAVGALPEEQLAQVLLDRAWSRAQSEAEPQRPWPWADTWPVARIGASQLDRPLIVLAGAHGASLAFAPGHLDGTPRPGATGNSVVAGHRDGSFASDRAQTSAALVSHGVRDDRWHASVAIPASAIEPDGTLLIGVTRERGEGAQRRRWAWPVALLPWEEEPGRVSVTLTDWYRLSR